MKVLILEYFNIPEWGGERMDMLERLELEAYEDGVDVVRYAFHSDRIKGLYCDGVIVINKGIKTRVEESCILAEELGHHYTTVGDIIDQKIDGNVKKENKARLWAANKKIGLTGIVAAYKYGCRNLFEMAEYLETTEEFLKEALDMYHSKYGLYTTVDNYIIYFEPSLTVADMNFI